MQRDCDLGVYGPGNVPSGDPLDETGWCTGRRACGCRYVVATVRDRRGLSDLVKQSHPLTVPTASQDQKSVAEMGLSTVRKILFMKSLFIWTVASTVCKYCSVQSKPSVFNPTDKTGPKSGALFFSDFTSLSQRIPAEDDGGTGANQDEQQKTSQWTVKRADTAPVSM